MSTARTRIYCGLLCALAVVLATKGIQDESVVSLQGDMPRYLMNGVYFYDLLRELPLEDFSGFTYRYYARYPALSLGHHPILPSVAQVPFFALFGVSVSSGRMATISFLLIGTLAWFLLIRSLYSESVALFSSLLLVTAPTIVEFSRVVMSEIPALALIILSAYYFFRLCESGRKKDAIGFILSFTLACYAKHLTIFMAPVYVGYLIIARGARALAKPKVIAASATIGILLTPLAVLTLLLSSTNVGLVTNQSFLEKFEASRVLFYLQVAWNFLPIPATVLSLISMVVMIVRREQRSMFFVLWMMCLFALLLLIGQETARFAIYWVPPLCLFAALSMKLSSVRFWRVSLSTVVSLVIGYQLLGALTAEPQQARGYEEAARYVLDDRRGSTVMYSAAVDTGYLVFFARKWDVSGDLVVLRADKVLATSHLDKVVEDRIASRDEIYDKLDTFGTCYVILEDLPYESRALAWLREEVKGDRFVLRHRIPIGTRDKRLRGVALVIFEYDGCGPHDADAFLEMKVPLANTSFGVALADLVQ